MTLPFSTPSAAATAALAGFLLLGAPAPAALAGTEASSKDKVVKEEKKAESRYKFSVYLDTGLMVNPNDPNDHVNFGRVLDDKPNEPMFNQLTLTFERPLVIEPGKFDWGFKAQAGVGSDGRYLPLVGTLENVTNTLIQPYVIEAFGLLHFPIYKDTSLDIKGGQFVALLGAETLDPRTNFFYSHNYTFNFGIPYQHLGGLAIVHANPTLDIYAGVTRGASTAFTDNNGRAAFTGGLGLNALAGGKLTIFASTHIGPENPRTTFGAFSPNGGFVDRDDIRYYNTVVATYKPTDKLTLVTEGVYTYDEGFDASFFGGTETVAFALNEKVTLAARFEAVHDDRGFYVLQFGKNDDYGNILRGIGPLDSRTVGAGRNTYLDVTLGAQIKPIDHLTIRPEVRFDYATENNAYDDSSKQYSITFGLDALIQF